MSGVVKDSTPVETCDYCGARGSSKLVKPINDLPVSDNAHICFRCDHDEPKEYKHQPQAVRDWWLRWHGYVPNDVAMKLHAQRAQ